MKNYLSVKEAATKINVKYATLLTWVNAGRFPKTKKIRGTRWMMHEDDIDLLIKGEINLTGFSRKESDIEKKMKTVLKNKDCIAKKLQGHGNKNWPDRIVIGPNGLLFFLEVKTPAGKLTKGQKEIQRLLREKGHKVFTCSTVDSLRKRLSELMRK